MFAWRASAGTVVLVTLAVACSHRPPADFAPAPGLVARIREIRMTTAPRRACPGGTIDASYDAVLDDGSRVPFATRYDKKHPPRLHVMFLERASDQAWPQEDGDWATDRDPLPSAVTGFRLSATLRAKPSVTTSGVLEPDYGCQPHVFLFEGPPGDRGEEGGDGPDVTVRLALLRSPFYEKLLVVGIEVGAAPPFYVLADAEAVPPSDWLIVESRGGRGGRGADGAKGEAGDAGSPGCPGTAGGPGGAGGNAWPGGRGGRGGRITVIAPTEEPFLAGLVDARTPGGAGGKAGRGGEGGRGGRGGLASPADDRRCASGAAGQPGPRGRDGPEGPEGSAGRRAQVIIIPAWDVFGPRVPEGLAALIRYGEGRRR